MKRWWMRETLALTTVAALALSACGEDGAEVASGGDLEQYCELQRELAAGPEGEGAEGEGPEGERAEGEHEDEHGDDDDFAEQIDLVVAAAPPEIAEEVAVVGEAYKGALESGNFEDANVAAEEEAAMHAFNEERCGIPNPLEEE